MKRSIISFLLMTVIVFGCSPKPENNQNTSEYWGDTLDLSEENTIDLLDYYVPPLEETASSSTEEGAVKYGAVIELGDLDELGRSTYAHIRLQRDQEPGHNGEERKDRISIDPAGWTNRKEGGEWVNNRCHLIGYQFSGLNDEPRNLATGTAYVNKGAVGEEMDESNADSMLYYEQKLDQWLEANSDYTLDYYVKPLYEGDELVPEAFYLQWVGIDPEGNTVSLDTGGRALTLEDNAYGAYLENQTGSEKEHYIKIKNSD